MNDSDLYALCVYTEASGEPYEGKVAVARVVWNRMQCKYFSDGTITGTVLFPNQFDAFWFDMVANHYMRISHTVEEATKRAEFLLESAQKSPIWPDCVKATADCLPSSGFAWGPEGKKLDSEPRALLYCNLAVSNPAWAKTQPLVANIFHHTFFKD